jgi:hypothetical protein
MVRKAAAAGSVAGLGKRFNKPRCPRRAGLPTMRGPYVPMRERKENRHAEIASVPGADPLIALVTALATATAASAAVWWSTAKFGSWSNGGYTLYNDVWGSGAGPQTIWANSFSNWGVWSNQPNTGGVKSFPNVTRYIGAPLSSLSSVTSSFNVSVPGSGAFETAYDIWDSGNAYETMLWMNKTGAIESQGWFGNITLGNVQFGWEITSSSGGENFQVNNYSVSG